MTKKQLIKNVIAANKKYQSIFGENKTIGRDWMKAHIPFNLISFSDIIKHFNTYTNMIQEIFKDNVPQRISSDIVDENVGKSKFVVSCIVEGSPINNNFLDCIFTYCKKNNAQLILLWTRAVKKDDVFSPKLYEKIKPYLYTEFIFNDNLVAIDLLIHPAQMLPLSGITRLGQGDTSLIISSPKQMFQTIPRAKGLPPHTIWSTGTISTPKYSKTRAGSLGKIDNTLGALIVEIVNDKHFFIRNVEYINDGFVDLGKKYTNKVVKNIECKGIVWGDLHLSEESEDAIKVSINQTNTLKAEQIVIHDLASFNSISHHLENKYLTKTITLAKEFNTLEKELKYVKSFLQHLQNIVKAKIVVVNSNHDAFIYKWIDEGNFIKDYNNNVLGAKFFIIYKENKNPIEEYMNLTNIIFLKNQESYKIEGIEVGNHGHYGANGGKGSVKTYSNFYSKSIIGHSHSPSLWHETYQVGTNSEMNLPYTNGASGWAHCNAVIFKGGYIQLILWMHHGKKWRL
jgi:hypothetical protein